jgi:hypothetical protein
MARTGRPGVFVKYQTKKYKPITPLIATEKQYLFPTTTSCRYLIIAAVQIVLALKP